MGIKVFESDCSINDSYLELDLGSALGDWYLQVDFMIPASTFTAVAGRSFTPDLVEVGERLDGFFLTGYDTDGSAHNFSFGNRNYWTEFDPGNPVDGIFTADAWHTLKISYLSGTLTWNIDGTDYFAYAIDLAGSDLFNLGGHFANHIASEVYYFDNYKLGTSPGASNIICDDFESGTFSLWTVVHGSGCSIVDDPLGTGGPSGGCVATLTANFTATPLSAAAPDTVTFTDLSTPGPSGPITAWDLDYGDGSSHDSGPGPWSHDYTTPGVYSPTLVVTGTAPDGTATKTRTDYIVVLGPDFTVQLTPSSLTVPEGGVHAGTTLTTSALRGDTESITLSADAPPGFTVTFDDNPIIAGNGSFVHVDLDGTVTVGTYTVTIHAVGPDNSHDIDLPVHVVAGGTIPGFHIAS